MRDECLKSRKKREKTGESFHVVCGTEENTAGRAGGSRDEIVELLLHSDAAGSLSEVAVH